MRNIIKYSGILLAITFVVALLLGEVNSITAPLIEQNSNKAKIESMEAVLGEVKDDGKAIKPSGETSVAEITEFDSKGGLVYAVLSKPKGYGGEIEMMVGIDSKLNVTGVSIISMSETPGLGARAKEPEFLEQFKGYYPDIVAISGATITSTAVKKGVYDALTEVGEHIE